MKGVKNIEDKNEKLLKAIEDKNEKQLKSIENQKKKKQLNAIEKINQLKLVSATFYQVFIFWSNDRPSKTMKNVFYFI